MDFSAHIFPLSLYSLSAVLAALWWVWAAWRLPWRRLLDNRFNHLYLAGCVALLILWNVQVSVPPTLHFHLLGVTILTLMFGWRFASFGVGLVLLGTTLNGQGGWLSFGLNLLCMGGVPIAIATALLHWTQRRLPHNFFVYIYLNAFLAAGLAVVATASLGSALLWLTDVHSLAWLSHHYLPYLPLMFFSEAVMNGMVMTLLVALRPAWVGSFDDNLYINGK